MSKPLRVLAIVGAVALIFGAVAMLGLHSGSRSSLRHYLAQLQAKGETLTLAELGRGRHTRTNDSHAVITNAQPRLGALGLSPAMLDFRIYAGPGQARVNWHQAQPVWSKPTKPEDRHTWEELDAAMTAGQNTLEDIRVALRTPALDAGPYTNLWAGKRINFVAIRTTAQWLMGATESDLHQGRLELALQNLEALAALALMERDEPTLVAQMIRVAVAGLGLSVTWEALQAPGWTEPQLERLQRGWAGVDLVDSAERGVIGERAWGYEMFAELRRSRGTKVIQLFSGYGSSSPPKPSVKDVLFAYVVLPVYRIISIDADQLFYLKNMQASLDGVRLLKAHRPWAEARQPASQVYTNITSVDRSIQRYRHLFSLMSIPNFTRALETAVETETTRQLTLAAIALKRYQLRHGQLPLNLEALVPEFLPAVPHDYMSGQPLAYRPKADGAYLLYSVGRDGQDDGGDATPIPGNPNGLWTGRDAVWPEAVSRPAPAP